MVAVIPQLRENGNSRHLRTRMSGGVGGAPCKGRPYPDRLPLYVIENGGLPGSFDVLPVQLETLKLVKSLRSEVAFPAVGANYHRNPVNDQNSSARTKGTGNVLRDRTFLAAAIANHVHPLQRVDCDYDQLAGRPKLDDHFHLTLIQRDTGNSILALGRVSVPLLFDNTAIKGPRVNNFTS